MADLRRARLAWLRKLVVSSAVVVISVWQKLIENEAVFMSERQLWFPVILCSVGFSVNGNILFVLTITKKPVYCVDLNW